MGYFCSISIYKLHLERPGGCAMLGVLCYVMSADTTAASSRREEMCLQFLWLLEFSSSFPAPNHMSFLKRGLYVSVFSCLSAWNSFLLAHRVKFLKSSHLLWEAVLCPTFHPQNDLCFCPTVSLLATVCGMCTKTGVSLLCP